MFSFNYQITPELLNSITRATELKALLEQSLIKLPVLLPRLQEEAMLSTAHASTAIEGNALSLEQVKGVSRRENVVSKTKDELEVENYLRALRWIWQQTKEAKITERKLLQLHKLIVKDTLSDKARAGAYKIKDNRVVDERGHLVFLPPPATKARDLSLKLIAWLNSAETNSLNPILVSAIAHHQLVSIHPFSDGNGRTARTLALWLLYKLGFDTKHVCALDEYYKEDRKLYYDKIQQARDLDYNLTYWLEYSAKGIVRILERTSARLEKLKILALGGETNLTPSQEKFLNFIRDQGQVGSRELCVQFKLTRARVQQVLKPLVENGLIIRVGQTRTTRYKLS